VIVFAAAVTPRPATAQDATWLAAPGSNDFDNDANWTPTGEPSGTATFNASSATSVTFSNNWTIMDGWTFNPGAPAYTLTTDPSQLVFNGKGIVTNGVAVPLNNNFFVDFYNTSSSGATTLNNNSVLTFHDSSNAAGTTLTNTAYVYFIDNSSAANATI